MIRAIDDLTKEVEREATILSRKMTLLQQWYLMGVTQIDDETWQPHYEDNVIPFPAPKGLQ